MDRSRSASIGELRAASAPPRGLFVNSGPHMVIFFINILIKKVNDAV